MTSNITAGTGDYRFEVDKSVTIDLNGYTIDRNLNEQQDNVFRVIAGGTLIIKDTSEEQNGKITGGWANEDYAGGINVREGTLILLEIVAIELLQNAVVELQFFIMELSS